VLNKAQKKIQKNPPVKKIMMKIPLDGCEAHVLINHKHIAVKAVLAKHVCQEKKYRNRIIILSGKVFVACCSVFSYSSKMSF
jgi:hypothetical protein